MKFDCEDRLILKILGGSHSYGTAIEGSDIDYRGIVVAPSSYYLGLDTFEQHISDDPDLCYYELKKFIKLAMQGNPNILELLFAAEYELLTPHGQQLVDNREMFLSKRCAKSYMGYALQQLKRMGTKPAPGSRSEKRMKLVEKYNFDTKYAMHVIRLLNMGIEVLGKGTLTVLRPEAAHLLDIRNGKFTLDEVQAEADELVEQLRQAEASSDLPAKANYNAINQLTIDIVSSYNGLGLKSK